jgi:hypothetical protein
MSMDSFFASVAPSTRALTGRVRGLIDGLRRNAPVLARGCGCLLPVTAVSVRDFEEALLLHVTERARVLDLDAGLGVPDVANLDDFLDWIERRGGETRAQSLCRALLEEMQRSLLSFSSQCAGHPAVREAMS